MVAMATSLVHANADELIVFIAAYVGVSVSLLHMLGLVLVCCICWG